MSDMNNDAVERFLARHPEQRQHVTTPPEDAVEEPRNPFVPQPEGNGFPEWSTPDHGFTVTVYGPDYVNYNEGILDAQDAYTYGRMLMAAGIAAGATAVDGCPCGGHGTSVEP